MCRRLTGNASWHTSGRSDTGCWHCPRTSHPCTASRCPARGLSQCSPRRTGRTGYLSCPRTRCSAGAAGCRRLRRSHSSLAPASSGTSQTGSSRTPCCCWLCRTSSPASRCRMCHSLRIRRCSWGCTAAGIVLPYRRWPYICRIDKCRLGDTSQAGIRGIWSYSATLS